MLKTLVLGALVLLALSLGGGWLLLGREHSTQNALASAEDNFRSSLSPGQAIHMVTQHYMRQPPVGGPPPTDITMGLDSWTEESYTILAGDGSVARRVTFEPNPDGSMRKVNSIDGKQNTTYDAKGNVQNRITLPDPLPFDIGYSELTKYVDSRFPSSLKTDGKGSGVTTLVGEIDSPVANKTLAQQAELAGLSPAKVLIRYQINEQNGLLADYQEIAVDATGKQTMVDEDKVTTAEVVSAPDFLSAGAQ